MSQQHLSQYFGQKTKSGNRKKEVGLSHYGCFHYKTSNIDTLQVNRVKQRQQHEITTDTCLKFHI